MSCRAHYTDLEELDQDSGFHMAFNIAIEVAQKARLHRDILPPPPKNWKEMQKHPYKSEFTEAAKKEFKTLKSMETFTQVDRSANQQTLPLLWVFTYKFDTDGYLTKFKARICQGLERRTILLPIYVKDKLKREEEEEVRKLSLYTRSESPPLTNSSCCLAPAVAGGFQWLLCRHSLRRRPGDRQGLLARDRICVRGDLQPVTKEDNYTATLAIKTFRLLATIIATFDLRTAQFDAVNAFLNGPIDRDVCVEMLEGFQVSGNVLHLHKALYGLRQCQHLLRKSRTPHTPAYRPRGILAPPNLQGNQF